MAKRIPHITLVLFLGLLLLWVFGGSKENPIEENLTVDLLPLQVEYLQGPAVEEGRPLLIDFWATWCGPCRETIPHMNQIHARYKDKGLQVVGITMEDAETVSRFTADFPMRYTLARDAAGTYFENLNISGIPHLVLIDAQGKITWRGHPLQLSDKRIEDVLSEYKTTPIRPRPEKS